MKVSETNDFQAFKPVLAIAGLLTVALLLIQGALLLDKAQWLIPPPEKTAEQFVSALGAHRYTGAINQLSQELRQQVTEEELQDLVKALENSHAGIQDAHELDSDRMGEHASARVTVKTGDDMERVLEFSLKNENGLWKLTSYDSLISLKLAPIQLNLW